MPREQEELETQRQGAPMQEALTWGFWFLSAEMPLEGLHILPSGIPRPLNPHLEGPRAGGQSWSQETFWCSSLKVIYASGVPGGAGAGGLAGSKGADRHPVPLSPVQESRPGACFPSHPSFCDARIADFSRWIKDHSGQKAFTVYLKRDMPPWRVGRVKVFASLEKEKRKN